MMFWRFFGKRHLVTNAELVELLNIPLRSVQRKIKRLKEQGIIERKGGK